MAFTISQTLTEMSVLRGEAAVWSFQDCDANGVPLDMTGRRYAWAIYQDDKDIAFLEGVPSSDATGPIVLFARDGRFTRDLYGRGAMDFDLNELLDGPTHANITQGTLTIGKATPHMVDYDAAPVSRGICKIRRLYNPANPANPNFEWHYETFIYDIPDDNGGGGTTPTPVPPANLSAPTVSGTATQGQTLTAARGSWSNSPTAYAYQWLRNGSPITNATGSTYVLTSSDVGAKINVRVTATNADGSATATSAQTATVAAPASNQPQNTAAPTITGTPIQGNQLTASNGTWSNNPTSYTYQWLRDGATILNATASTFLLTPADVGHAITVRVTATNANGSAVVVSAATSSIARATTANTPISSTLTLADIDGLQASANSMDARIAAIIASFNGQEPPTMANTFISSNKTLGEIPGALEAAQGFEARIDALTHR